jgi:proline racemase
MKTGTAPSREWLLITHPTIEDMTAVTITIPDYQNVVLDLTVGGQYWHIVEGQAPVEVTV